MIRVINILVGAVIGFTVHGLASRATDLFVETGRCSFGLERDGTFWQADQYTNNYMHPGCASLGVADKWKGSDLLGWRVSFLATGPISARGNIATNDENRHYKGPCDLSTSEANCMVEFNGSGRTYGITVGFTAEQSIGSHLSVIGESGLFFFQHHYKAEARFVDCCTRNISYNETSHIWDQPSPFLGFTLQYRSVYVAARHFWPSEHRALSQTNHAMNQIVLGLIAKRFQ